MARRRVLALTTSPLPYGDGITDGPGFRMWNLLHEVAREHDVRILSLYEGYHEGRRNLPPVAADGIMIQRPNPSPPAIARLIREWDPQALYLPWSAAGFLGRGTRQIPTVLDYVGPGLLERFAGEGRVPIPLLRLQLESFWLGDLFLTTTARERFYLIGLLAASGRLSTRDFRSGDPLVRYLPMTPPNERPPPRSRRKGPGSTPLVVLLAGAFLAWYDYDAVARAASALRAAPGGGVRFLLVGGNPRSPETEEKVRRILEPARRQGVVEFSGLVPFHRRGELYNTADVALVVAPESVEDELSARTRVVDYMWGGLPVVTRGRDEYSRMMLDNGAAFEFGPGSSDLTEVLGGLASDPERIDAARKRIQPLLDGPFNGPKAARPLLEFLADPVRTRQRAGRIPKIESLALWASDMVRAAPRVKRNG
ncbi:MAG: glycosyltransferase [Thermoplasmata archaeon]|nr:glycosyltransferase [Thermoplasmata archaeon]